MRVALPERSQGVACAVRLAHLLDARSGLMQSAEQYIATCECFVERPPRRANLSALDGGCQRFICPTNKQMRERQKIEPNEVLRIVRVQRKAALKR
jgi:hypothetical protein